MGWVDDIPGFTPEKETPGTHCTGSWMGPRAGLDGCGKSCPPIGVRSPGPSSPQRVAIPTELSRPILVTLVAMVNNVTATRQS